MLLGKSKLTSIAGFIVAAAAMLGSLKPEWQVYANAVMGFAALFGFRAAKDEVPTRATEFPTLKGADE